MADPEQNERIGALDKNFRGVCAEASVAYVTVFEALLADPVWLDEVRHGDGSHPGAGGYDALAGLVLPQWCRWITSSGSG